MKKNLTRRISILVLLTLLLVVLGASDVVYFPINYDKLDWVQRYTVDRINERSDAYLASLPEEKARTISYQDYLNHLNFLERRFVERVFAIKSATLGFKGPFFSMEPVAKLTTIPAMTLTSNGEEYDTGVNFMPDVVFADYDRMMQAMDQDLGQRLYIDSAYRSPGYQAKIFFDYLGEENNYSLKENAGWVAMPGYSEHGSENTALDFINKDGISGEWQDQTPEDFEKLPEYQWLMQNAAAYNFYLTYPRNNPFGVNYESWHWHWEIK